MAESQVHRETEGPVILHLHIRTLQGQSARLLDFLRGALPFYERIGGTRVRLLQSLDDPDSFIEVVEYRDRATYMRDRARVEADPEMKSYLERWRALLAGGVQVKVYLERTANLREGEQ